MVQESAEVRECAFSAAEAALFRQAVTEAQAKMDSLNAMIRLAVAQRSLAGNWQLKQDASGLVKQE